MAGDSGGLRPLTIVERHYAWLYGLLPCTLIYIPLVVVAYFVSNTDKGFFHYIMLPDGIEIPLPFFDQGYALPVLMILARGMYLVAYFTWGRTLGHRLVEAHVIDQKTGRRMNNRQKLARGLAQMLAGFHFVFVDGISFLLIVADRERRRSLYDHIAGTVVVVGDLPPEEEKAPSRSWVGELARSLRSRPAPEAR